MQMMGYTRQVVAQHERALLLKNGVLTEILGPGVYRWLDLAGALECQVFDLTDPELNHPHAEVFRKDAAAIWNARIDTLETGEQEAGLVYLDGRLTRLLRPMSRAFYWKGPVEVRMTRIDLSGEPVVERTLLETLRKMRYGQTRPTGPRSAVPGKSVAGTDFLDDILEEDVADHQLGLLIQDGRLLRTLEPGVHAFWNFSRNLQIEVTDLRLQELEVSGQEILTKDKVSLRINLGAHYRMADPVRVRATLPRPKDHLYRELQFALRQAVGEQTLDELLAEKGRLEHGMLAEVKARAAANGIAVEALGIKDVILPGDMKQILNQVVEAEKAAQANLIRRREETAATRSLLNTAKLMEQNPLLLRLKELEALERVTERVGSLTVFGGLESVLQGLVRIEAPKG